MCRTHCGASQHIIIPSVPFGIADDRYSQSSMNNRSGCNVHHITHPLALASRVLSLSLKQQSLSSLAEQYPWWRTRQLFRGARSPSIIILLNQLPCPCHFSTHLAFWTTTVSGLLCCSIVTVTLSTWYIFSLRIHIGRDQEVCRYRLNLVFIWNVKKYDVRASIYSYMLIPSGNNRVAIVLHLLMAPLMWGINPGDTLSGTRESLTRSFLHTSSFGERGSDWTICSRTLTLDLKLNRCSSHRNICGIWITLLEQW